MADAPDSLNDVELATGSTNKMDILDELNLIRVGSNYEGATAFLPAYARLCRSSETKTYDNVRKVFDDFKNGQLDPLEDELDQTVRVKRKSGSENAFNTSKRSSWQGSRCGRVAVI
ncbi:hypothetical protein FRB95_001134 [Tulasnella sp. JGI-2019a]|nr:hypothetical protein FRB95_001134 [Tulasnella sp. JGI-2019a]